MSLNYQKRLAAKLLNVGVTRVWVDPDRADDVLLAVTGEDVRKLIDDGAIRRKPMTGVSRGRKRAAKAAKRRGLKRGLGSRKGRIKKRVTSPWVLRVRSQRDFITYLRRRKVLTPRDYRGLYRLVKGGAFQDIGQIKAHITAHKLAKR